MTERPARHAVYSELMWPGYNPTSESHGTGSNKANALLDAHAAEVRAEIERGADPMTTQPTPNLDVKGRCPACGGASLFLGSGGYVTCARLDCPQPDAASSVLEGGADNARTTPDNPATSGDGADNSDDAEVESLARILLDHRVTTLQRALRLIGGRLDIKAAASPDICELPHRTIDEEDDCERRRVAATDEGLRELYAAAIVAKVDGTRGCANGYRLADAVLAVRDAELQQARAERDRSNESARRFLAQRQEMAAERYAWQERGDRAETALAMQKGVSADLRVESRARGEKLAAAEANLADLHAWLSAEAAHHHAAVPLCSIPEAAQAHDGMGAGLDIAARVVEGLIAGRGLPVSGRGGDAGEVTASGHGETPGDGGDGR